MSAQTDGKSYTSRETFEAANQRLSEVSRMFIQVQRQISSISPVEFAGKVTTDEICDIAKYMSLVSETIARAKSRDISKQSQLEKIYGR